MWLLYNLLFPIGFLLLSPFYFWKMERRGNWRAGFDQRFGLYDTEFSARVGEGVDGGERGRKIADVRTHENQGGATFLAPVACSL